MEKTLDQLSVVELKALAYDIINNIERYKAMAKEVREEMEARQKAENEPSEG